MKEDWKKRNHLFSYWCTWQSQMFLLSWMFHVSFLNHISTVVLFLFRDSMSRTNGLTLDRKESCLKCWSTLHTLSLLCSMVIIKMIKYLVFSISLNNIISYLAIQLVQQSTESIFKHFKLFFILPFKYFYGNKTFCLFSLKMGTYVHRKNIWT